MREVFSRTASLLLLSGLFALLAPAPGLAAQELGEGRGSDCASHFERLPADTPGFLSQVLEMQRSEFAASLRAQKALFDAAFDMAEEMNKLGATVLGSLQPRSSRSASRQATPMDHRALTVRMKRNDPQGFLAAVLEKMSRKGYRNIKQVSDLARGRIDLDDQKEMLSVVSAFRSYGQIHGYRVQVQDPRRPIAGFPGHFGYPRYHITLTRPDGLEFEWQVGVGATSRVWERPGIRIPRALRLPEGMTTDLHDIEYRILQPIWKKAQGPDRDPAFAQLERELKLKAFSDEVDRLAAESAIHGSALPDLERRIRALHDKAGALLKGIVDKKGPGFVDGLLRPRDGTALAP